MRVLGSVSLAILLFGCFGTSVKEVPSRTENREFPGRKVCIVYLESESDSIVEINPTICRTKTPPLHAFHPAVALAALESGSLKDPNALYKWNRTKYPYIRWQKDLNLQSATESSAIWYFQKLVRETSMAKTKSWLQNAGLPVNVTDENRAFWLEESYSLNGEDFFGFLRNLVLQRLPARDKNRAAVLATLERSPGKVSNPTGTHTLDGNWGEADRFYSDSGTAYIGGRSLSLFWFFWKSGTKSRLFFSRAESETEILNPLEAARIGTEFLQKEHLWERFFFSR